MQHAAFNPCGPPAHPRFVSAWPPRRETQISAQWTAAGQGEEYWPGQGCSSPGLAAAALLARLVPWWRRRVLWPRLQMCHWCRRPVRGRLAEAAAWCRPRGAPGGCCWAARPQRTPPVCGTPGSAARHGNPGCLGGSGGRRCADRGGPWPRRPAARGKRGTRANPTAPTRPFSCAFSSQLL